MPPASSISRIWLSISTAFVFVSSFISPPFLDCISDDAFVRVDLAGFLCRFWSAGLDAHAARSPARDRNGYCGCGNWRDSNNAVYHHQGLAAGRIHSIGLLADRPVRSSIESIVPVQARILRPEVSPRRLPALYVAARTGLFILLSAGTARPRCSLLLGHGPFR